jgi:hypothetical protein
VSIDLLLDPTTGDLDLAGGRVSLVRGADAVRQELELSLGIARGEWFLDLEEGLPYRDRILRKGADEAEVRGLLRRRALRVGGVAEAEVTLVLTRETRTARATVRATTAEGVRVEASVSIVPAAGTGT